MEHGERTLYLRYLSKTRRHTRMIRLKRSSTTPRPLRAENLREWRSNLLYHYSLPPNERASRRLPEQFDYISDPEITRQLFEIQRLKCGFCETRLEMDGAWEVTHYRPPSNAGNENSPEDSPDYYNWLSHNWKNLILSCRDCARSKRNIFPVQGPRAPPMCSWAEAEVSEHTLLLNPYTTKPYEHLGCDIEGLIFATSEKGEVTVRTLNLNRSELTMNRRSAIIHAHREVLSNSNDLRTRIDRLMSGSASYPGAVSLFLYQSAIACQSIYGKRFSWSFGSLSDAITTFRSFLSNREWEDAVDYARKNGHRRELAYESTIRERFASENSRRGIITNVRIENFKGINSLDLRLETFGRSKKSPCTMILGENSSGKSSFLQAIALTLMKNKFRNQYSKKSEDFQSREPMSWNFLGSRELKVELTFESSEVAVLMLDPNTGSFKCDLVDPPLLLGYGAYRRFERKSSSRSSNPTGTLFSHQIALPDPTLWLQQASDHDFNAVARAMREILGLRLDDQLLRDEDGRVVVRALGRTTPLDKMSDGYKSVFAVAVDVMKHMVESWGNLEYARGVVLIDEIEAHLHPRWKVRIVDAFRRAMPLVQFIATTHDPLCLRGMFDGEVHVLYRDDSGEIKSVDDLPDVSSMRAEQLLTSDFFGLSSTSDPSFEDSIDQLQISRTPDRDSLTLTSWSLPPPRTNDKSHLSFLGDDPTQQVISEALLRFTHENSVTSLGERSGVRKDAVEKILKVLEERLKQ